MGNLGFDPLGLLPTDPKERYDMQSKELNNGRLAMIAIAAFVAQELVSKDEIFEHVRQPFPLYLLGAVHLVFCMCPALLEVVYQQRICV